MKKISSAIIIAFTPFTYAMSESIIINNSSNTPIYGAFQSIIMEEIAPDSQNGVIHPQENHNYLPDDKFFSSTTVNIKPDDVIPSVGIFDLHKQEFIICDENVTYSNKIQYSYDGSSCTQQERKIAWIEVVPGDVNQIVSSNSDGSNPIVFAQREGLTTLTYNDNKLYTRVAGSYENGVGVYDLNGNYLGTQIALGFRGLGNTVVDPINNWVYNSTELLDVIVRNDLFGDGSDSSDKSNLIYDPVKEGCMADCVPMGLAISEHKHKMFFGVGGTLTYPAKIFQSELGENTSINRSLVIDEEKGLIVGSYHGVMNIAVDDTNQKIYWNTSKAIQRSNFDGSELENLYLEKSENGNLFALELSKDSKYLYWSKLNNIYRLNLESDSNSELIHQGKHTVIAITAY